MGCNSLNSIDVDRLEAGLAGALHLKQYRPEDAQLRILIFTACYFVLDGVTLTIRRLEGYLRSRGVVVKVLSTVPDEFNEDQIRDIIVVPGIKIPFTHAGAGYAFGGGLDDETVREIERFNPNCVHFTVPDLVALDGIRWCQRNNVAFMATWHSNYCDYLKYYFLEWILKPTFLRYLQGFYEQMPAVYVPTPYIRDKMVREGFGKHSELKEWGRGVDLKLFSDERRSVEFRSSRGISDTDVVILWVGRLVPEKQPEIWMNVVQRLQAEGIKVKAMVVGHGTFEATLTKLDNCVCCGWLSGVALAEAYASADILLFPSAVETFGNVTLEALASGCVCVVEDLCGGHLIEHGVNGYTCTAGDTEKFYQATKRLIQDDNLRLEMSKNARQSAWKFERSKILQQMAENYKDAIVRHQDPAFIKRRLKSSPEAAGRNFISLICCNYWCVKTFAEPLLNTTSSFQNLAYSTTDCVQHSRSRLSCSNFNHINDEMYEYRSRYEDERKGRAAPSSTAAIICTKTVHYVSLICSYLLIFAFIYASLTM